MNTWTTLIHDMRRILCLQQLMLSRERRLIFSFIFHFHSSHFQLKKIMGIGRRKFRDGHFSGEYQPPKKIKITKRENGKRCTFSFEASTTDSPKPRDFLRCKRAWKDRQSLSWLQTSDNTKRKPSEDGADTEKVWVILENIVINVHLAKVSLARFPYSSLLCKHLLFSRKNDGNNGWPLGDFFFNPLWAYVIFDLNFQFCAQNTEIQFIFCYVLAKCASRVHVFLK